MRKKTYGIVLAFVASTFVTLASKLYAGPDADGMTHVVGQGGVHCMEAETMGFLGGREEASVVMLAWIKGYITARNQFDTLDKTGNISRGVTDEDIMRWVKSRCGQCPSDRVATVVIFLTEELYLRQKVGTATRPYNIFSVLSLDKEHDPICVGD